MDCCGPVVDSNYLCAIINSLPTVALTKVVGLSAIGACGVASSAGGGGAASIFISVKDNGALGDGTTDDATAINACIAGSPSGAIIYFPAGTYVVGATIELLADRYYFGATHRTSIIQQKNGANLHAVVASKGWLAGTNTVSANPLTIRELKIDGNKANQTAGDGNGLVLQNFQCLVSEVLITQCFGAVTANGGASMMLTSQSRSLSVTVSNTANECKINNCEFRSGNGHGFMVNDPGNNVFSDGFFTHSIVQDVLGDSVRHQGGGGWVYGWNHFYGGIWQNGFFINKMYAHWIVGNYLEGPGLTTTSGNYYAINCGQGAFADDGGNGSVIAMNRIRFANSGAGNVASIIGGIIVSAASSASVNVHIFGNQIHGVTQATLSRGIRVNNQSSTSTMRAKVMGNAMNGIDTPYSFTPNSGVMVITGDAFQTLATTATDGFGRSPGGPGVPTGVPVDLTQGIPTYIDTTNNDQYAYYGAAWHIL